MTAEPEPTKRCARCKADKPLSAFDEGRKKCGTCKAAEAARRSSPKPADYKTPKPGETPMRQCQRCGAEKVYSAFLAGLGMCRECMVDAAEPTASAPESKAGKKPTEYSVEVGEAICERVAMREPLHVICAEPDMPSEKVVYRWRREHEDFAEAYDLARAHRADARADKVDEYLDALRKGKLEPHTAKVLIEGELRLAGKEMPARYGDRVATDVTLRPGKAEEKPDTAAWLERVLAGSVGARSNVVPLLPAPAGGEEDAA